MNTKLFTKLLTKKLEYKEDSLTIYTDFDSKSNLISILKQHLTRCSDFNIYLIDPQLGVFISLEDIEDLDDIYLIVKEKYIGYEPASLVLLSHGSLQSESSSFLDYIGNTHITVNLKEDTILIIDYNKENQIDCQQIAEECYLEVINSHTVNIQEDEENSYVDVTIPNLEEVPVKSSKIFLF